MKHRLTEFSHLCQLKFNESKSSVLFWKRGKTKPSNYPEGQEEDDHKESEASYKPYPDIRNPTQSLFQKKKSHSLIFPSLNISSYITSCFLVNIAQ